MWVTMDPVQQQLICVKMTSLKVLIVVRKKKKLLKFLLKASTFPYLYHRRH